MLSASAWVAQCDGSRIWCGSSKGEVVESCHALLAWERVEVGLHLVVLQNALKASWLEGNEADVQGGVRACCWDSGIFAVEESVCERA